MKSIKINVHNIIDLLKIDLNELIILDTGVYTEVKIKNNLLFDINLETYRMSGGNCRRTWMWVDKGTW